MVLSDIEIERLCREENMIEPFHPVQISSKGDQRVISYGLSSFGYDVRIAREFKIFTNVLNAFVDPKALDSKSFVSYEGDICVIPPNSFILGRSIEYMRIPRDVLVICLGKSTLARIGLIVNVTPLEPCVSEDTELLTKEGWKRLALVEKGDLVLTRKDGGSEYQPVQAKQVRDYSGDLLHFKGRSVDQLVTPDHRLAVFLKNSMSNAEFRLVRADEVYGKYNYSFDRKVNWLGTKLGKKVEVNGVWYPTNWFLRFLGMWLGDGSAFVQKGGYIIKLACVTKERNKYYAKVLDKLGFRYSKQKYGFSFFSKSLCQYLIQFGRAKDKYIDRRWLEATPRRLHFLLEGLMQSEGTQTNTYTTVSRRLADDVQELIYKAGYASIITKGRSYFGGKWRRVYRVRQSFTQFSPKIPPKTHSRVPYTGRVYDITVPNHVFLSRRKGKVSWTGNCWEGHITIEISNSTPLPARIYAEEGIMQLLFIRGDQPCRTSYADRSGKYQGQTGITLPK